MRSTVPKMELDSAFEAKEELAHAIRDSLQQTMGSYGYVEMEKAAKASERAGDSRLKQAREKRDRPRINTPTH